MFASTCLRASPSHFHVHFLPHSDSHTSHVQPFPRISWQRSKIHCLTSSFHLVTAGVNPYWIGDLDALIMKAPEIYGSHTRGNAGFYGNRKSLSQQLEFPHGVTQVRMSAYLSLSIHTLYSITPFNRRPQCMQVKSGCSPLGYFIDVLSAAPETNLDLIVSAH